MVNFLPQCKYFVFIKLAYTPMYYFKIQNFSLEKNVLKCASEQWGNIITDCDFLCPTVQILRKLSGWWYVFIEVLFTLKRYIKIISFHSIEIVSRYRGPQFPVAENYSYLLILRLNICKSWCLIHSRPHSQYLQVSAMNRTFLKMYFSWLIRSWLAISGFAEEAIIQ